MKMKNEVVIGLGNVTKTYALYDSHSDRVKEAFHPFRKKYHRPFNALQDISLDIHQGEFMGIIGRNGSGKSTLLQLVSGILLPTKGTIHVNGTISALLELGAGFNPEFSGRENVFFNGAILGVSQNGIEELFPQIEAFADIGEFIDQPVKTYSSGMYVRLAFAVAISIKPDILIVDEALAVGDMFFQQKCIRYMEEEMKDCTKVLVTHDMHAVMNLCERVAVLDQGKLVFVGDPLASVEHYTKTIHNELFTGQKKVKEKVEERSFGEQKDSSKESSFWIDVQVESIAGASDVVIKKVNLSTVDHESVSAVKPGDILIVKMQIEVFHPIDKPIFGYMVKDRVGNGICGDNSLSLDEKILGLDTGSHVISFELLWPEIAPADYSITLGIGQGDHPLHHVIQCWAHNVLLIKAVRPGEVVHGLFTNPIRKCEVEAYA